MAKYGALKARLNDLGLASRLGQGLLRFGLLVDLETVALVLFSLLLHVLYGVEGRAFVGLDLPGLLVDR